MKREKKTIAAMIALYCADHHNAGENLCNACHELQEYAWGRLDHCPFQENKPTCAKCLIHCYKTSMKETILVVMRYAGPRMLSQHPVLGLGHVIDALQDRYGAVKSLDQ